MMSNFIPKQQSLENFIKMEARPYNSSPSNDNDIIYNEITEKGIILEVVVKLRIELEEKEAYLKTAMSVLKNKLKWR